MYIIKNETISNIIEKNSKFITHSYKVYCKEDIIEKLKYLKTLHPKANHHCYAYILENEKKSSDDKEPKSTAGPPILNVLEKNNIINTLIVVIRYFGGIELGAGPLTRAYSLAAATSINKSSITKLENAYLLKITIKYEEQKQLNYLLKDIKNIQKNFTQEITYIFNYPKNKINELNNYNYLIMKESYIEKESI